MLGKIIYLYISWSNFIVYFSRVVGTVAVKPVRHVADVMLQDIVVPSANTKTGKIIILCAESRDPKLESQELVLLRKLLKLLQLNRNQVHLTQLNVCHPVQDQGLLRKLKLQSQLDESHDSACIG